ncbi:MAG TPA: response regulator, partial [Desulfuromonadaceae bacterium]
MSDSARILVVDDKQSFRFMIKGYLIDGGYQATCVASGIEALAELERSHFDLVVSDMVMPEMDGVTL